MQLFVNSYEPWSPYSDDTWTADPYESCLDRLLERVLAGTSDKVRHRAGQDSVSRIRAGLVTSRTRPHKQSTSASFHYCISLSILAQLDKTLCIYI
jgi:hypothetical protein